MKFTKEEKIVFVKRYQDGETVLSVCNENQIPHSTFYRWIQDYQQKTVTDTGTIVTPQEFLYLKRTISNDIIKSRETIGNLALLGEGGKGNCYLAELSTVDSGVI